MVGEADDPHESIYNQNSHPAHSSFNKIRNCVKKQPAVSCISTLHLPLPQNQKIGRIP